MSDNDKIKELEEKLAETEKELKIKELEEKIDSNKKKMSSNETFEKSSNSNSNEYDGLYCSSDDKIVLGLCGGLAHKLKLQTSVVRFGVFLSLFFFIGWFYLVGLFLPKLPTKQI